MICRARGEGGLVKKADCESPCYRHSNSGTGKWREWTLEKEASDQGS